MAKSSVAFLRTQRVEWRKKGWKIFLTYEKKKKSEEERRNISQVKDASIDERVIPSSDMGRSQKLYEKRKKKRQKKIKRR